MVCQFARRVGNKKETAMRGTMRGKKAFIALAITAVGVLATTSAAWSIYNYDRNQGGYVKPCSLDGVNPAHHPGIFGNPALARAYYGFVQWPDRTWHVQNNCRLY
jgi:hypothetical protein